MSERTRAILWAVGCVFLFLVALCVVAALNKPDYRLRFQNQTGKEIRLVIALLDGDKRHDVSYPEPLTVAPASSKVYSLFYRRRGKLGYRYLLGAQYQSGSDSDAAMRLFEHQELVDIDDGKAVLVVTDVGGKPVIEISRVVKPTSGR
jgi:hypothetical protein